jgi:hypothetical protein
VVIESTGFRMSLTELYSPAEEDISILAVAIHRPTKRDVPARQWRTLRISLGAGSFTGILNIRRQITKLDPPLHYFVRIGTQACSCGRDGCPWSNHGLPNLGAGSLSRQCAAWQRLGGGLVPSGIGDGFVEAVVPCINRIRPTSGWRLYSPSNSGDSATNASSTIRRIARNG